MRRAMRRLAAGLAIVAGATALWACVAHPQGAIPAPTEPTPVVGPSMWVGRWMGPEGTYLDVIPAGGAYDIVIRNLNGARTFSGHAAADRMHFTRDGVSESIRAGTGADTGMKWLADKSQCLVVKRGEGYCRADQ